MWPSAATPSSVHWRRFYFQLALVHSALELSEWCALQIYLLTYLFTCLQLLTEGCRWGHSPDGYWQTVPPLWSGNWECTVAKGWPLRVRDQWTLSVLCTGQFVSKFSAVGGFVALSAVDMRRGSFAANWTSRSVTCTIQQFVFLMNVAINAFNGNIMLQNSKPVCLSSSQHFLSWCQDCTHFLLAFCFISCDD